MESERWRGFLICGWEENRCRCHDLAPRGAARGRLLPTVGQLMPGGEFAHLALLTAGTRLRGCPEPEKWIGFPDGALRGPVDAFSGQAEVCLFPSSDVPLLDC